MDLFNKILVPTDGSDYADAAAKKALDVAKLLNAEVTILSIVDVGSMAYAVEAGKNALEFKYNEKAADAAVQKIARVGKDMGLQVKTLIRQGSPANEIIEESKNHDLIVMGSLGRTGLSHLIMGSVAEKVVRFASCPVLVVRKKIAMKE